MEKLHGKLKVCGKLYMMKSNSLKYMNTISVYDGKIKKVEPISTEDTLKRRGKV